MSFKQQLGRALEQALTLGMGEDVTLNQGVYTAVVEMDEVGTTPGARGGRRTVLRGQVTMRLTDWQAAAGKEGDVITLPDGMARINSKPTITQSTAQFRVEGVGA